MEAQALLRRSPAVPPERTAECAGGKEVDADDRIATSEQRESGRSAKQDGRPRSSSPSPGCRKDWISAGKLQLNEQLKLTKAEIGEAKQENERLKTTLSQIMEDYRSLQRRYFGILKQVDRAERGPAVQNRTSSTAHHQHDQTEEDSELISLSLGTSSSGGLRKIEDQEKAAAMAPRGRACQLVLLQDDEQTKGSSTVLSLGRLPDDCRFAGSCSERRQANASPESGSEETKEEGAPAGCRAARSEEGGGDVANSELIGAVKRARVSVRARCDAPTMNDGCKWRKYGQKISKGNLRPRAYYRCTLAPSCPVRKQVQRCGEDMSILITTYEGTHNHPLPISATAMASTTSAAAAMLMSGSTASTTTHPVSGGASLSTGGDHHSAAIGGPAGLHHGLEYYYSGLPRRFYRPPNLSTTISDSPSCPTITLDLTAPAPSSSSPAAQYGKRCLPFAATSQPSINAATSWPAPWSSAGQYLNYHATHPYINNTKSLQIGFSNLDRSPQQPLIYGGASIQPAPLAGAYRGPLTETAIAAAARVITSDPSFLQTALAAAIKSVVGGNNGTGGQGVAEPPARRNPAGWEEKQVSYSTSLQHLAPSSIGGNGCASSFLTRWSSSSSSSRSDQSSQQATASTMPPQPSSLALITSSKSTSASPCSWDHAHQLI